MYGSYGIELLIICKYSLFICEKHKIATALTRI